MPGAAELARKVRRGDQRSLALALNRITDEDPDADALCREFFPAHGRSHKVGVCGPPGTGKSSLINRLVACWRRGKEKVGVLAVDPTSPFTGGAFLGDRLRIQEHASDPGVFIRSLATRGMMGGLNATIFGAVHALEAYGCDRILIETVGTGQDEVDIANAADTVLCVSAPNQGDEFQAMKAGTMEIADIFVVNKADLPGAERAVAAIEDALGLGPGPSSGWRTPVAAVSAAKNEGFDALCGSVDEHRAFLGSSREGLLRARRQLRKELSMVISRQVCRETIARIRDEDIDRLWDKKTDPAALGRRLIKETP